MQNNINNKKNKKQNVYFSFEKKHLPNLLISISKQRRLFAPALLKNSNGFDELTTEFLSQNTEFSSKQMKQMLEKPSYSPKKFFLPKTEDLFNFSVDDKNFEAKPAKNPEKIAIFGIHSCDLNAIDRMDLVFGSDFKDTVYSKRRQNALLIGLECSGPFENCFCQSMNTDKPVGFDLFFWNSLSKTDFIVEVGSSKGQKIIDENSFFKKTNSNSDLIEKTGFSKKVDLNSIEKVFSTESCFENPVWKKEAERCFGCGSCTAVCPSCYCFDVFDKTHLDKKTGKRIRVRDSCMLREFTRVAGNHITRESRSDRLKQRVYHKFFYFNKKFNKQLCVGCGRCTEVCVSKIDHLKIIKEVLKKPNTTKNLKQTKR